MASKQSLCASFIVLFVLATILILVAMVTPGWVIVSGETSTTSYYVGINPFYMIVTECTTTDMLGESCVTLRLSDTDYYDYNYRTLDYMWPSMYLGGLGLIMAVLGLTISQIWARRQFVDKRNGVYTSLCWSVAAVCMLLGIVLHQTKFSRLEEGLSGTGIVKFPYSVLLCGLSMFCCFVLAVISIAVTCKIPDQNVPGNYTQFTNPVPVVQQLPPLQQLPPGQYAYPMTTTNGVIVTRPGISSSPLRPFVKPLLHSFLRH